MFPDPHSDDQLSPFNRGPDAQGLPALKPTASTPPAEPIPNVLAERYASPAMQEIWSAHGRILLERDFWIAVMKAQRDLGVAIPAEAIKLAVAILDGQKPADKHVLFNSPGLATDLPAGAKYAPDSTVVKMELGKNVFPDLAPGISLPISPDWVEITPKEAAGS